MFTPKCTRKGCGWVGLPKSSEAMANQAVAMHVGRIHTKNIPTFKGPYKPRKKHGANGTAVIEAPVGTMQLTTHRGGMASHNGNGGKRPYTKRQTAHNHNHAPGVDNEVQINNCWNCGAQQADVATGVVIARMMKANPVLRLKFEKILAKY